MPSVVLMLPLLNTCAIIIFGLVFHLLLSIFPSFLLSISSHHTLELLKNISSSLPISLDIQSWKLHSRFLCPFLAAASTSSGLAAAHSGGPERDRQGEAQRGGCQGIASGVNRTQGGSGMCSQDLCCAWRCFPKKGGQPCHPHKGWCSFLQGEDCFPQPLHPRGREMGLTGTRQDELVGSSPGARPTEKAGSSCRGM